MGERSHHSDDESTDTWHWMVRGFVTVAIVVVALAAVGVWLWLRPLRDGPAQSFGLWLGCMLLVGCAVLVWSPERRRRAPDSRRVREWLVVGALVAVSGLMALVGVVVAREDRRPVLRGIVEMAVEGQPVTLEQETTWAYQPRFVGGLGRSDWSVCRTFVVTGPPGHVAEHVTVALEASGVEVGDGSPEAGDTTFRYGEVRVEGEVGDRLVVCVDEVDPANRSSAGTAPAGTSGPTIRIDPAEGLTALQRVTVSGTGFPASAQVGVVQCAAGGRDEATCDRAETAIVPADDGGAFTVGFRVRDAIATAYGVVDCSTAGACEVVAGVPPDAATFAAVGVEVTPSSGLRPFPVPSCPSPFVPVGYVRGAVDVPDLPPNVTGTAVAFIEAGAAVSIVPGGDALLLTVSLGGSTRELTTAPHPIGGNYDRTPDPSVTSAGLVSIVTGDDGAIYVTLTQNNSGDYTRVGWRFDDPCAAP